MPAPFGVLSPGEVGEQPANILDKLMAGIINGTVQIPKHVIDATVNAAPPGLRREDFTDAPPPMGLTAAWQPGDEMRGAALEAATLPMGTGAIAGVPMRAGEAVMGAGPIRAYHGSPHDFDRFDLSKIGTGEGAQAYGHGLYFADREGVARSYRDALAADPRDKITEMIQGWHGMRLPGEQLTRDVVQKGLERHHMAPLNDLAKNDRAIDDIVTYANGHSDDLRTVSPEAMAAMRRLDNVMPKPGGHMYEVNINADPEHFLDWDRPIKRHPFTVDESVTDALRRSGVSKDEANYYANNKTGQDVVRRISRPSFPIRDEVGAPWKASNVNTYDEAMALVGGNKSLVNRMFTPDPAYTARTLNESGIPGIKYQDQGSRAPMGLNRANLESSVAVLRDDIARLEKTGGGNLPRLREKLSSAENALAAMPAESRNYVVFNDKLIDILKKYGIAGAAPVGMLATSDRGRE